jgi:4-amino-4-deoxy-L-arabinose transferase-like glycosyltransferase
MKNKKIKVCILLGTIIFLGLFLRFVNIDNAPPGIYPDEGVNGEDALRAVKTGNWQWFYTANNGREGLFINFIGFFFKLFGVSIFTLKLPSILFGGLIILGVYLLTKELFKKSITALIASFLTAVSFWAINFSRISFRAIMLPAVLVFAFYFLWRGIKSKKFWPFIIGGFIFGIGLHTYIAFRIAPLILVFTLIFLVWENNNFFKTFWKQILLFLLFALISASPILITFYIHPEYLESRSASISIFSPELNQGHLVKTFLRSLGLSLAKYNFWGDQNWRHNYPPYPILNPLVGVAFLGGLIYFVIKFFSQFYQKIFKKIKETNLAVLVFLLSWFFLMLSPEFLTAEGLPHALRSIGTLPVVYILAAWTFVFLIEKSRKYSLSFQKFFLAFLIVIFIFIGLFNSLKYHIYWAQKVKTASSFDKNLTDIVQYLKKLPVNKEKFIIVGNMQRVPIKLLTDGQTQIQYFYPDEIDKINPQNKNSFEIIMTEDNQQQINFLENKLGPLRFTEEVDDLGSSFYVLKK